MSALANYDAACRALAQAASVDEVLNIRDQAEAMRAYGRQAKNRELETYAQEIRLRAERKLGELIIQQKETVGLAPAGRPPKSVVADDQLTKVPTLAEMGISKDLSSRAQKLAAVPEAEFEANIVEHKQRIAAENARVVNKLEKAGAAAATKRPAAPAAPELLDENARLIAEMAELSEYIEQLRADLKESIEDNEKMGRVFDADDRLKAAMDEVKRQTATAESAKQRLDAKTGENNELIRTVKRLTRDLEREKQRADAAERQLAQLQRAA